MSKLLPLMAEAQLHLIANPLINITLQGRHDTSPKRRGMTRVPELPAAGINVAFGHDCVMDPWYGLGSGDMMKVAHIGLHVGQMTGQAAMHQCFDAVTVTVNPGAFWGWRATDCKLAAAPTLCYFKRVTRWRRCVCAPRGSRCSGAANFWRKRQPPSAHCTCQGGPITPL